MSTIANRMDERIQIRASNEEKTLLKLASEAAGFRNLTNFIMNTMINESRRVLKEQGNRTLSERDSEIIISSLMDPPKPNDKLKRLLKLK
jgi:uncharacterized protein (DUF1778 family)